MKKFIVFILSAIFFVGIFSGCSLSNDGGGVGEQGETDGLKIVVTVFPEYDWLREIMGEVFFHRKLLFCFPTEWICIVISRPQTI